MRSGQKRRRGALFAVVAIAAFALLALAFYEPDPGPDAPRVLVSVDRTLWHRLGLSRLTYLRALRRAGLSPVLVDYAAMDDPASPAEALLDGVQGLVVSGGGDVDPTLYGDSLVPGVDVNRRRDQFEIGLLAEAERRGLPVLGICRGAQLINVYKGGTLGDMRSDTERFGRHRRLRGGHAVQLVPDSRLAAILGTNALPTVVTYHGQYVDQPGEDVTIVAYAEDGTPEAIEIRGAGTFGMLGVQWHAEVSPWDPHQARLFAAFRDAADAESVASRGAQ